jgi:hypothetical protein
LKILDDFVAGFRDQARTSPQGSPGRADEVEDDSAPATSRGLIQVLFQFVEEIIGSADSLIEVYSDRIKLSVRRTIVQAVIGTGLAVCAAVWLGAAALAVLRGVCGGFAALWGGREWLGDLTGGVLALAFAAGAAALYLRLSSRRELRRLRAKYERIRNQHSQDPTAPAEIGGGVA